MEGDAQISHPAMLIGDPARAAMLMAMLGGRSLPASDLAAIAGVKPSTASEHLARLTSAGLVTATRSGRHRYFTLSGPDTANAIEALSAIAPRHTVQSLAQSKSAAQLGFARSCYDHLAGAAALAIADRLIHDEAIAPLENGANGTVAATGHPIFTALEMDVEPVVASRRPLVRGCLDWTQRRPHLAGALGARLFTSILEHGWAERARTGRGIRFTALGRSELRRLGVVLDDESSPAAR
ncbi:ArsR/SmtB family transcription factor [Glaciibacter superstes]|uniref:ArsR/SmtB family transcription factor n=1 Tax=Glaciibacter superstes TaxID=501023 RepID=UPI0003B6CCF9|nr:helix-turn-helix domain-containing protein [Glaciibacter superstes]